jgi:hypothetical protein
MNYWVSGLCPLSSMLEPRKHNVVEIDLFLSSGERRHTYSQRELTDPVSETLCFLENWMIDKVQNPSNSGYHTPLPEPFRIYSAHELVCS